MAVVRNMAGRYEISASRISNNILRPSECKIIKFLALNGPSNRYEISKGTEIHYQTVYSAIKRLLEKGLFINIFDVEKARTDFDKPSYFATFVGKLAVMAITENDDDDLDLIATSEPRQFLILEEWEYICRSTVARNYVLSIIRTRFLDLLRTWDFEIPISHAQTWTKLDDEQTWPKEINRFSLNIFVHVLLRSFLWDGYPRGGVPRLIDYGREYGIDILEFFVDNPQIREQIKVIFLGMENDARVEKKIIGKARRRMGLN